MPEPKKARTIYLCQECGLESVRWQGRCPECNAWNTFTERTVRPAAPSRPRPIGPASEPIEVAGLKGDAHPRLALGIPEFDRVLGGGVVPGSLVLIGGDPGIGKCLAGSTRVLDPVSGSLTPIVDWCGNNGNVVTLDDDNHLVHRGVIAFHEQGIQDVVDVTTRLGHSLRCTPSHPVLTPNGWRPISTLGVGAYVAAPRALPCFGSDDLDEHYVRLIAYTLSDGSATSQVTVTSALSEVPADLADLADWFGVVLRTYAKRNNRAYQFRFVLPNGHRPDARRAVADALKTVKERTGITWAAWATAAHVSYELLNAWRRGGCVPDDGALGRLASAVGVSVADLAGTSRDHADMRTSVARYLESVGLRYRTAATKAVPDCIFRLPREQVGLFLKVLFSCDGSVYVTQTGVAGVSYSTISRRLAEDVQHLLLRFGFVTRLRTKRSVVAKRPYTAYEIQLLGIPHVKRYLSEIGIWGREEAKAKIALLDDPYRPSSRWDVIPTGTVFWTHLRASTAGA
ncbi:MAG: LAGLIDADG family homing endonuclease, partial [Dehalococcoidia bacterium]